MQESAWEWVTKLGKNVTGRQKEWEKVGDRYRDSRETTREGETENLRENVIWSECFWLHAPFALLTERESDGHWQELNQ